MRKGLIFDYMGKKPRIASDVYIAPTAVIIGDVEISRGASIWFGTVLRGDMASIYVGRNTNIQDNCTVHTEKNKPAIIEDHVTIGHNAVIHGCLIERQSLIGIGSVVLTGAHVRKGSVVAAGAVVTEGQKIGPHHLVTGSPAALKKVLDETHFEKMGQPVKNYQKLMTEYKNNPKI